MSRKKENKKDDKQSYLGVAVVFFVVGMGLVVYESTRVTGIPFLVLGITFFGLSQQHSKHIKKK